MEKKTQSLKFLRQRKFYAVLSILVLPFITLMFWVLGGGKETNTDTSATEKQGFNVKLPDAYLKENKALDKMSYYNKAQEDSAKLKQMMKDDPYYLAKTKDVKIKDSRSKLKIKGRNSEGKSFRISSNIGSEDTNEIKIRQKLEQLNATLDNTLRNSEPSNNKNFTNPISNHSENDAEIQRLEELMLSMDQDYGDQTGEEDPEMQQLNSMLEKILDIQHPDRVQEKIKKASKEKKGRVFQVSPFSVNPVSLIDNRSTYITGIDSISPIMTSSPNGFYSIDNQGESFASSNTIQAVVHETQTLVNGSTVKMRLLNDIYINGIQIPKDNFIFGIASLNGERLQVNISDVLYQNHLLPVSLSVYDLDGINGIYIPGAIERDVGKQSADRMIQSLNMNTLDPSLGTQVASAGIEAAKSLFSKKVKLIKVTVKAGYQVILQDEKQSQDL